VWDGDWKVKKIFFSTGAVFALAVMSLAQVSTDPTPPNPAPEGATPKTQASGAPANALDPGTLLSVELSKSLDARKSKANDRIEARTATDILAHGRIVVRRDTKILGHVTAAKPRTKEAPDSMLGITFDRMQLKSGNEVPLQIVVQAVARPLQPAFGPEGNMASRPGLSGQRVPLGDASTSNAPSAVPPTFPGDLAVPPDPMAPRNINSTVVPLSPTSHGIVGMKGLSLETTGSEAVLNSNTMNVHLDGGTQLILRIQ
jgi:hypothetical protein